MNVPPQQIEIGVTPAAGQAEVLSLVFSGVEVKSRPSQVAATLAAVARGEFTLAGLLEARRGEQLVGAVWSCQTPGNTALLWPARLVEGEEPHTAELLHEAVEQNLAAGNVRVVQALLGVDNQGDAQQLISRGFQHATDLLYMGAELEYVAAQPPVSSLTFQPYTPQSHNSMVDIIQRTYEQTMDCPWLDGVRDIEDVLTGYRQTGQFDSSRWLLAQHKGHNIGCLLMADHPQQDQWELVYMGIVPSGRGRGWGLEITRHGLWMTRNAGRRRVILAVDVENTPAISMYANAGFEQWVRQQVFLRVF